jgi:sigma-B regulation protein RsbU (phosphoserine phosphatase)
MPCLDRGMVRTLIADDQPDVLEALRLLLKDQGFEVATSTSPAGVLEHLSREQFDLLLMDLNYARCTTSGREGLDLLAKVQELDSTLPVVAMTAWSSVDLAVEAMQRGVQDFVQKPWDNARLIRSLCRQAAQGRVRRLQAAAHQESAQELAEAREVEQSLLPKALPEVAGISFAASRRAARSVSGDYFDAIPLGSGQIALAIGDVMGKGLPAALLMANLQAAVRANCTAEIEPAELCGRVNRAMCENMPSGRFITFFFGVLDAGRRTLRYSNAGHGAQLLVRADRTVARLADGGLVLGVIRDAEYRQGQVALASGDRLALYTDGLPEARNPQGEEFGEERLLAEMVAARGLTPLQITERLLGAATAFGDLHDDATLLIAAVE